MGTVVPEDNLPGLKFEPVSWLKVNIDPAHIKEWARDYLLTRVVDIADLADPDPFDICLGNYIWTVTETSLDGWMLLEEKTSGAKFLLLPMTNIEERLGRLAGKLPTIALIFPSHNQKYDTRDGRLLELRALSLLHEVIPD